MSQEEGINLSGIKRILDLERAEQRSRRLVAELHAEVSQLRDELESTRAVAARLAGLLRTRTEGAALVPVRPARPAGRPGGRGAARPQPGSPATGQAAAAAIRAVLAAADADEQ